MHALCELILPVCLDENNVAACLPFCFAAATGMLIIRAASPGVVLIVLFIFSIWSPDITANKYDLFYLTAASCPSLVCAVAEGLMERGTTAKTRAAKNAQIVREAEEEAERQEAAAQKPAHKTPAPAFRSAPPSRGQPQLKAPKAGVG